MNLWFCLACEKIQQEKEERIMEAYGDTKYINDKLERINRYLREIHILQFCENNFSRQDFE